MAHPEPEPIHGWQCQVCLGEWTRFSEFRLHRVDGEVCPGGEP